MAVSQMYGGPYNKDYSILGSILGSPDFGKPPYGFVWLRVQFGCKDLGLGLG